MFSLICSTEEAPNKTQLTPSFFRHHAEKIKHLANFFLLKIKNTIYL